MSIKIKLSGKMSTMKSKRVWILLSTSLFLVLLYTALAYILSNFAFQNYDYIKIYGFIMVWIPSQELQSQLWKLFLLLPAVFLSAVALTRAGLKIPIPRISNYRLAAAVTLIAVSVVLLLSIQFLFHGTEVTDDENTYDFQAQTLMAGRLTNPAPPVMRNFYNTFIIIDGKYWVGKYTIGHPAVIALGMVLGNRYIGIIIISILTLLLLYQIAMELYGNRKFAFFTLCLGALSPFFYLVSSSRLSHTTSAFFLALFMYLFLRTKRADLISQKIVFSLLTGLCFGYAFNTRPLTAIGFLLPFIFFMIKDNLKSPVKGLLLWSPFIAGSMIALFFTLWYNSLVTGNPFKFPFNYYSPTETLGFGTYGHTFLIGLRNLTANLFRLNASLFGFSWSLLFAFVVLFSKKDSRDFLAFGIIIGIAGLYLTYYAPGVSDLGPVYYYDTIIPLLLLSGRGMFLLKDILREHFKDGKIFFRWFLALSFITAFATFIPERITHVSRLTAQIRAPYKAIEQAYIHHAIVMIQPFDHKGWVFGHRNTSPDFTDDVLYCRYIDSVSNRNLIRHFQDRLPYVLQYDSSLARFIVLPVDTATGRPFLLE